MLLLNSGTYFYEYQGDIQTLVCVLRYQGKIYTFDLQSFYNNQYYISLNDMYPILKSIDQNVSMYHNHKDDSIVYNIKNETYQFEYSKDKIKQGKQYLYYPKNNFHIYISHKNVYVNVFFIEKMLINYQKIVKIQNKTAIIE